MAESFGMKKHILFVDDDPLLREFYAVMMDKEASRWTIALAENGAWALAILAGKKFDVVVSDLRMPEMDGIELMREVRQRSPQTSRIIISGLGDQEQIAKGLETTHQFLAKPVKPKELFATLSRIGKLDAFLLDEKLKALVGRLDSLPSFPSIYLQIIRELNTDDPSIADIADIAIQDPALTAKMLQVANSAAFGLAHKVSNPFEAVQFIGLNAVRSIALSAHVFRDFESAAIKRFSAQQLWDDALRCAQITRQIMRLEKIDEQETEDACTAAMLRNAGKLMLAKNLPQEFQQTFILASEQNLPLPEAERKILGATHAGVAAYLFGLWGLAAPMVEAVAFHLQPSESETRTFSPLTAVHVAHVFANELWPDKISGKPVELDQDYLAAIGISNRIDRWRNEVEKLFNKNA
jgi:HD-like signal output (HDOD) protein/ActR/RegA family two-component response regulator